ncbi:DHA2 family efflux MFS transporter permease subunit [Massilia jejuensis]|uniref:DHA2 family efflux MFS transporter permease subunit n=1 Tax=Massilia jejuensis TaxID=648894 RepID=A0ABW0PK62_9BURK
MDSSTVKTYLPWLVATALFMEQLDATVVNTAIPSIALSLGVTPLSLKSVVTSYILGLAVGIPVSGWMADRYGTRRVFLVAIGIFTLASVLCGLAPSAELMTVARLLQGLGGAMMMPVGRLAIVRTFPKAELMGAMNFVIIPALIGPLLGPTVGGLIVHWTSWRAIFFINVPFGLIAMYLVWRHMPDYRGDEPRPLDIFGLILFSCGTAMLSWLLEIFGEHTLSSTATALLLAFSIGLLAGYALHASRIEFPLLRLTLLKVRTFRISVLGGFVTRLGVGGLPFLLPLLYQLGLGLPAWQSGLLMMPSAVAAMGMKLVAPKVLARFGYRQVLVFNTLCIGVTIALYGFVGRDTPLAAIVVISLMQGFFNSLQFSSMNTLAYADIEQGDTSMASTISSSFQQLSMSFGLAAGSLVAAWFLGGVPQTNQAQVTDALHHAFWALAVLTMLSAGIFYWLRRQDGDSISRGRAVAKQAEPVEQ